MAENIFHSGRFYLEFQGKYAAAFTELSGLSLETEVFEYTEGGFNDHVHRLPGRSKIGNIVFKRGITQRNEFFNWCLAVSRGQITKQNMTVKLFETDGTLAMSWEFIEAFPVKWTGPSFTADSTNIAIESVEFAHAGFRT